MIPGVSAEGLALSTAGVCKMNTIHRMSLISVFVCAVMALVGCGKKAPPAPEPDTTVPINDKAITPPVGTDKDGKPEETPKTDAGKDAPVLDAVTLTRELGKNPAAAERYQGKVVRIEGVVLKVFLKPTATDPASADITLRTATDSPVEISSSIDKASATKVGPWQKVIVQGTAKKLGSFFVLEDATIVKAGPVAFTQVELEHILKEQPKTVAELKNLGVSCVPNIPNGFNVTLENENLTPEGVIKPAVLNALSRLTKINWLGLSGTRISDMGIKGIEKLIQVNAVEINKCEKIGVRGLVPMKVVRGLVNLSCNDTPLTDEGLEPLRDLIDLQVLNLANSRITDAGLSHLTKLPNLIVIDLSNNKITDACLAHIKSLTKVQHLFLAKTQITGQGLANLKGFRELTHLDLKECPLLDVGLEPLGSLPALYDLNLEGTRITDAGVAHLAKAPKLEKLDAKSTAITDAGLEHLAGVKTLASLYLRKRTSKVTEAGMKKLKTALPKLDILVSND